MSDLKPGDRVTSPLLVGEWQIWRDVPESQLYVLAQPSTVVIQARPGDVARKFAVVPTDTLARVKLPLPTEPPVGSVVWALGTPWWRDSRLNATHNFRWVNPFGHRKAWVELSADDLSPVVPVSKVAEWLDNYHLPLPSRQLIPALHDEFGWPEDGAE